MTCQALVAPLVQSVEGGRVTWRVNLTSPPPPPPTVTGGHCTTCALFPVNLLNPGAGALLVTDTSGALTLSYVQYAMEVNSMVWNHSNIIAINGTKETCEVS